MSRTSLEDHAAQSRKREERLRARCRQMNPCELLPLLSSLAARSLASDAGMRRFPPHELAHVFEAACAYYQPYARRPVTIELLARTLNEMRESPEPGEIASLESDDDPLARFGFLMSRLQFGVQGIASGTSMGRAAHLLGLPHPPTALASGFTADMAFSPADWPLALRALDASIGELIIPNGTHSHSARCLMDDPPTSSRLSTAPATSSSFGSV